MRPLKVTYQQPESSEKSDGHTGVMFPASIKLWEPNSQIQQYFQENSDRLRSILLQGRDPRPGNAAFIFLTAEGPKSPPNGQQMKTRPAFDDSVS